MITCSYCGRENSDEAEHCSECGTPLRNDPASTSGGLKGIPNHESSFPEPAQHQVSLWLKWLLWLLAWGSLAIFTALEHPEDFKGILGFPFGFCGLLPIDATTGFYILLALPVVVVCGWLLYLKLTVAIHKAKTLERFLLLYVLLCLLLAINAAGCRRLITIGASIH